MSDLLKTVVVMTITGSVLALALFALKPFVKNRLPKAAQYYLWLVVLAALLVPFSRFVTLPAQYPALSDTVSYYLPTQEELFNRVKPYETELPSGFIGVPEADMPTVEALVPSKSSLPARTWTFSGKSDGRMPVRSLWDSCVPLCTLVSQKLSVPG